MLRTDKEYQEIIDSGRFEGMDISDMKWIDENVPGEGIDKTEPDFKIIKKDHNGINFTMYQGIEDSRGEVATKSGKFHLEGKPSVTQALNQYKYGDEIIIQVFNKPGSLKRKIRVNQNWDRIQVFFNRETFINICKQFLSDIDSAS